MSDGKPSEPGSEVPTAPSSATPSKMNTTRLPTQQSLSRTQTSKTTAKDTSRLKGTAAQLGPPRKTWEWWYYSKDRLDRLPDSRKNLVVRPEIETRYQELEKQRDALQAVVQNERQKKIREHRDNQRKKYLTKYVMHQLEEQKIGTQFQRQKMLTGTMSPDESLEDSVAATLSTLRSPPKRRALGRSMSPQARRTQPLFGLTAATSSFTTDTILRGPSSTMGRPDGDSVYPVENVFVASSTFTPQRQGYDPTMSAMGRASTTPLLRTSPSFTSPSTTSGSGLLTTAEYSMLELQQFDSQMTKSSPHRNTVLTELGQS